MILFLRTLLLAVGAQGGDCGAQLGFVHVQRGDALIEALAGGFVDGRVVDQRQVVGGVGAGARKAEALDGFGDGVGQAHRVFRVTVDDGFVGAAQAAGHADDGPGKGGRIAAVDIDRVKAVERQMLAQPVDTANLRHGRALVDTPAVGDHDRHHQPAVFTAPPARRPVAAALLLEGAVAEEGHQFLPRQRHVYVLQAGKAEVAAFADAAAGVRIDVAAKRYRRAAFGINGVAVEVLAKLAEPGIAERVALGLRRVGVAQQHVDRINRRHAVPLAHQPAAGSAGQGVGQQVTNVGRHHIQCAAGVAFGLGFEVALRERAAVQIDLAGVGHVRHLAHRRIAQPVGGLEQQRSLSHGAGAVGGQLCKQVADAVTGQKIVVNDAEALAPVVQRIGHAGSPCPVCLPR